MSENGQEKKPASEKYYQSGSNDNSGKSTPLKASRSLYRSEDFEQDLTVDLETAKTVDFASAKNPNESLSKEVNKSLQNKSSHHKKSKSVSDSHASHSSPSAHAKTEKLTRSAESEKKTRLRPSRDGYSQKDRESASGMTKVISRVSETVTTQSEKRKKRRIETISARIRRNRRKRERRRKRLIAFAQRSAFFKFFNGLFGEKSASPEAKTKLDRFLDRLSSFCYTNRFSKLLRKLHCSFCFCEAKIYGAFLLTFGLFVLFGYLSALFWSLPYSDTEYLSAAAGLACVVISLPLLFSRHTISSVLENSFITDLLFFKFLGARKQNRKDEVKGNYFYPIALGIILGSCGFFVSPVTIVAIQLLVIFFGYGIGSP